MRVVLVALSVLLAAGYVGIDVVAPLPRFLYYENLVLAALYVAAAYGVYRRPSTACPLLAAMAGFNAGRVSRSVVTPTGEPGPLALEHVGLLALVLLVSLLSAVCSAKTVEEAPAKP